MAAILHELFLSIIDREINKFRDKIKRGEN